MHLLRQQGKCLVATHQCEAVARQNHCQCFGKKNEVHNYNVQIQVRPLEQEAVARLCLKDRGKLSCPDFPRKQTKLLRIREKFLVTEVTSEVWRQDEQLYDLHQELGLQALHADDVSQHQTPEHAGLHQHLTGLVQETQQYREMFEDSRTYQSAAGPDIDRLRRRENSCEKYDVKNNERANSGVNCSGIGQTWSLKNPGHQKDSNKFASCTAKLCNLQKSAVQSDITRSFVIQDLIFGMNRQEAAIESQKPEIKSRQRDLQATQDSLNTWDDGKLHSI